jgi:hypothetical protein
VVEEENLVSISANILSRRLNRVRRKKRRTGKEFRLDVPVVGYDIR